jgi:cytochrome c biogenesis protein CcmG/thiol:disulfide interchange protein DsbE
VKNRTDRFLVGLIVVLAGALVWVVSGTLEPHITSVGDKAPSFTLVADNGRTYTPTNFGGKILVLNFWATWCEPCVEEVPSLNAFSQAFGPKGVVVLGVAFDSNQDQYQDFLKRYNVHFANYRDPEADISARFGTFQYPETYVIDQSGRVLQKVISNQNWMSPDVVSYFESRL